MSSLSVIIPTLNAASALPDCLAALEEGQRDAFIEEVIVVDGGSRDTTVAEARALGARVIESAAGRGVQLAAGAKAAAGDWLLFLHADTRLQAGWVQAVRTFAEDPKNREHAAVFRLAYDVDSKQARRVAAAANWRARRLGLPYGDQGLLIARGFYDSLGGYCDVALMEDVILVRRIGRRRLIMLEHAAITSAERYSHGGWWARPARNLSILGLYFLGVPPRWLKRLYG